jgi:glucokinase
MISAGDIGGTATRLALVEAATGELKIVAEQTFPSRERTSLGTLRRKMGWTAVCHLYDDLLVKNA